MKTFSAEEIAKFVKSERRAIHDSQRIKAADIIAQLQAENARLREELNDAGVEPHAGEIESLTPDEVKYIVEAPGWYLMIGEPSALMQQLVNKGLINLDRKIWETTKHAQRLVDEYRRAFS